MIFKRKPWGKPDNSPSLIRVRIRMRDGRDIVREVTERDYAEACYDLRRHTPNADSRIFIGDVVAHPADFTSIERD